MKEIRTLSFDIYNQIKPRASTDDVVIIDIDEASLARKDLGQWPWSRNDMAALVEKLSELKPKAIVFDLVFAEEDRTSPHKVFGELSDHLKSRNLQGLADRPEALPDFDQTFAQTIQKAGNVVTGFVWSSDDRATRRPPYLARPFVVSKTAEELYKTVPRMQAVTTNIPVISQAAAGNGNFGVRADLDGLIRRVPLIFRYNENGEKRLYPSLALEAVRVSSDPMSVARISAVPKGELGLLEPEYRIQIRDISIPFDKSGLFYVYFAPLDPDKYIPAYKALDGDLGEADIRDKIVFIATSAEGLKDIRSTPLDLQVPGVEVHRNIVEQVLSDTYLLRPHLVEIFELMTIGLVGFAIIVMSSFTGVGVLAAFTFGLMTLLVMCSWISFDNYGLLLDPVYPSLYLVGLFILASVLGYLRLEQDRRQIRKAFGLYISPEYMQELTRDPEQLRLGGETRTLTVMFSDIRNFTSICENLSPDEIIRLMNDFLTPMSERIMRNRGTIDKYIGDAIMAFWNAPLQDDHHAANACLSALEMNAVLGPLNDSLARGGKQTTKSGPLLKAGIGIATGSCAVGNMGSRDRFAYSALGDAVNIASRLEGLTKTYQVPVLIDQQTCRQVPHLATLEMDMIRVAGRQTPERIFYLAGAEKLADSREFKDLYKHHSDMIAQYYEREFEAALTALNTCRKLEDGTLGAYYNMFEHRLREFIAFPPPADWDGVWQTQKSD